MLTPPVENSRSVVVVHTSDMHIGAAPTGLRPNEDGLTTLTHVVDVARSCDADLLVLAGDTFDHARVDDVTVSATVALLAEAPGEVVILPGNHDCLSPTSPLGRPPFIAADRIHVIGITTPRAIVFDSLDVEVWGRPHQDHAYMRPLGEELPKRISRWRVVVAHGHWTEDVDGSFYGWPITRSDLEDLDADYVALGHWDNAQAIDGVAVPCHYSGAPGWAGTVNVVTFAPDRPQTVFRRRLREV